MIKRNAPLWAESLIKESVIGKEAISWIHFTVLVSRMAFSWLSVQINQRYTFVFWKLRCLPYLSLTRFSTLGGKICNSGATEHGDLLFIHSCQSNRSNGVYTFLMSQSNGSFTLYIDSCRAQHHGSGMEHGNRTRDVCVCVFFFSR